ncbi:MAG: hypothetical protein M3342_18565, partial [Bacteroidota bacterium]|nr:hypothetical protein [Bacteroidota bacterium]
MLVRRRYQKGDGNIGCRENSGIVKAIVSCLFAFSIVFTFSIPAPVLFFVLNLQNRIHKTVDRQTST